MKKNHILFLLIVLLVFMTNVNGQDWPNYLGPTRNSTSTQKGILRTWPASGPQVMWATPLGIGFGGPVAKDGKIYLLDRDDQVGDKMRCFDLATGKELWNFAYNAPGSVMFPGSRSVPALDGNYIYSCGPYGDLYCIDINTHKPVWNKNVWKDYGGGQIPQWAITQCPLIYGNLLIIASQAPGAGVVAYDKLTGSVKWTTPTIGGVGYASPSLVKIGTEDQVVMMSAGGRGSVGKVVGLDPLTGKQQWEYTNWQCSIPVPSALDAGESRILITGGYEAGSALIKIAKKTDGTYGVTELFKNVDFGSHTQEPILVNGYFYAQYSTNERKDGLVCMGMDGKVRWKTGRAPGFDKGGMIVADGLILSTDGVGKLYLIQPDATGFKPIASADLLKAGNSQNWAPIALINGMLIIRDQSQLMCVKVAQ